MRLGGAEFGEVMEILQHLIPIQPAVRVCVVFFNGFRRQGNAVRPAELRLGLNAIPSLVGQ
jgi:hypothetical protein